MTPEERAHEVEIVEVDLGDWFVANWRVNTPQTVANIAAAIRVAENDRTEECAKIVDLEHEDPGDGPDAALTRAAAAIRALKKFGYIVDNPRVGKELTKMWSYSMLYPAKTLVKMATGKLLSPEAFIKNATMPIDAVLKRAKERIARLANVPHFTKPVDLGGRIIMWHGKKKIADNSKSFEDMDRKYRAWLKTQ